MRNTLRKNRTFLILYALFFCIALPVILISDKVELHQYFNKAVTPAFNAFFEYITYLGDGIFSVVIAIIFLFFNVRKAITVLIAYVLSAGFTQAIKYGLFSDADRPELMFEKLHLPPLTLVKGMTEEQHIHMSFPSGHATAAFALFFCLGFFAEKNVSKLIFFLLALIVAFSRVYLSQHFFEDITAGSFIAVFFSSLVCGFFYFSKSAQRFDKLDTPIYKLF
ncbi:MAG: phosphatase PAP2 family protein [Bacteroidia bacterium]